MMCAAVCANTLTRVRNADAATHSSGCQVVQAAARQGQGDQHTGACGCVVCMCECTDCTHALCVRAQQAASKRAPVVTEMTATGRPRRAAAVAKSYTFKVCCVLCCVGQYVALS
jgi:hypothetical protein